MMMNKFYPAYFKELINYPKSNPIFISSDSTSVNFIRRLRDICLFFEKNIFQYEFNFCFQREIWVLYSQSKNYLLAVQLAEAIQLNGADKILVLRIRH